MITDHRQDRPRQRTAVSAKLPGPAPGRTSGPR